MKSRFVVWITSAVVILAFGAFGIFVHARHKKSQAEKSQAEGPPVLSLEFRHELMVERTAFAVANSELQQAMVPYNDLNKQIEAALAPFQTQREAEEKTIGPIREKAQGAANRFNQLVAQNACEKFRGAKRYELFVPPIGDASCVEAAGKPAAR